MSIVCVDRRFVFIHVARTGGTSISRTLQPLCRYMLPVAVHPRAYDVREKYPNLWYSCFSFSFVRNPWDVWVSWYHANTAFAKYRSFRSWMLRYEEWYQTPEFGHGPQVGALLDENGEIMVDFVGRYEYLKRDFHYACCRIGFEPAQLIQLPSVPYCASSRAPGRHYREYYDDETREIAEDISAPDIERFGYEF